MPLFSKRSDSKVAVTAVIVAAGSSVRMGENKMFIPLLDRTVIEHTVDTFVYCRDVTDIVLVTSEESIPQMYELFGECDKLRCIVRGGVTRTASVSHGVNAITWKCDYIAIHDGARPLVTDTLISNVIHDAKLHGAATAAVASVDTVKIAKDGFVQSTPLRSTVYSVQTPQVFRYGDFLRALGDSKGEYTDDCQLMEEQGYPVYLSQGDSHNIKVTTPGDIALAEFYLEEYEYV